MHQTCVFDRNWSLDRGGQGRRRLDTLAMPSENQVSRQGQQDRVESSLNDLRAELAKAQEEAREMKALLLLLVSDRGDG